MQTTRSVSLNKMEVAELEFERSHGSLFPCQSSQARLFYAFSQGRASLDKGVGEGVHQSEVYGSGTMAIKQKSELSSFLY
jgi:hypothetical protein